MKLKAHKKFVKKSYEEYKRLECIECPAFDFEKIYFNKIGFNHLLWKGKKMRKPEEQIRRINLLPLVTKIICSNERWVHYRESREVRSDNVESVARFWSFSSLVDKVEVRVIIRQTNNGRKYFFSIM